ncbi:hypothetical protein [Macrococcus capreoli]|uniref:hypothetical protein n=1 Tax=Macrococcus capreoli TaxID=2982690 RepID=UPI003EE81C68
MPVFSIYRQSFWIRGCFPDFFAGIFDLPAIILDSRLFSGFLCRYFRFTGNHFGFGAVFLISLPVFSIYRQSFWIRGCFPDFFAGIFDLPAIILDSGLFSGFLCRYFRFTGNHSLKKLKIQRFLAE